MNMKIQYLGFIPIILSTSWFIYLVIKNAIEGNTEAQAFVVFMSVVLSVVGFIWGLSAL